MRRPVGTAPGQADFEAVPGTLLADRFLVGGVLGKGASGAVFRAYDEARGMPIAIKMLTALDPGSLYRFKSEFRLLANLAHPNLLQLHELLRCEQGWLLTMELVEGSDFLTYVRPPLGLTPANDTARATVHTTSGGTTVSVRKLSETLRPMAPRSVERRRRTPARTLSRLDEARLRSAFVQLCDGLHALHRAERLHRDLKPANVLVTKDDGRAVICDFGLVLEGQQRLRMISDAPQTDDVAAKRFDSRKKELAGTLVFMAPEQARAEPLSPASDWYAAGVMLYQALTGRLPIDPQRSLAATLQAKLSARIAHPRALEPHAPVELADLALALLHPDPKRRAGYAQAIAALDHTGIEQGRRRAPPRSELVGRVAELETLLSAFHDSRSGAPQLAMVSGPAGIGKSALVNQLLMRLEDEQRALVLRSRCYEREQLPYKTLDPLIDALSSYLVGLEREQLARLLPESIGHLAALFPALRRVRAVQTLCDDELEIGDPSERKRLAFAALRELCRRLAEQRPLVLSIDDLQWGDLDGAASFKALLSPPQAPAVLVVCAYRSEHSHTSALLVRLREDQQREAGALARVEVVLEPLEATDALALATATLDQGMTEQGARTAAAHIVAEAGGSPFLVRELATHVREHGLPAAGALHLSALVREQLAGLNAECRELIALIALVGRPLPYTTIRGAVASAASRLGLPPPGAATYNALRELERRRLVTSSRVTGTERVTCHHDRIRETVLHALTPDQTRVLHHDVAAALEAESSEDWEALFEHSRGAGEVDKARSYALRGAEHAEQTLALGRAADLYLKVLDGWDGAPRALRERLGHALMHAGRGAEAAATFNALVPDAGSTQALRLRMLATTQLLRAGKISAGFDELARADDLFGIRFPRSRAAALAMLLIRKTRIRLAERAIVLGACRPVDHPDSERLETLWEVAAALTNADFLRGGVYGGELALRAIASRDPAHIAGACGLEAVNEACAGRTERTQRWLDRAEDAAQRSERTYVVGRVRGLAAICRQLEGRWREAVRLAHETFELLRADSRINWDLAIVRWWELSSAACVGDLEELVRRVPDALRDAETRGDAYAATEFRTHRSSWAWLAVDRPDTADAQVDIAEREWTPGGYQFQHWHMLFSRSEVDLYRGTPTRSYERMRRDWSRARLVRLVQGVDIDMRYTRARLALAQARRTEPARAALLRAARADATALLALPAPWSRALGKLVMANSLAADDRARARHLYGEVMGEFATLDMRLHVEVARLRRAQLAATPARDDDAERALETARGSGARHPERFLRMLLPEH